MNITLRQLTNQQLPGDKNKIHTMEVHHHPHPGKKKFKEYFFEFLMLFLAVTLGFLRKIFGKIFLKVIPQKIWPRTFTMKCMPIPLR